MSMLDDKARQVSAILQPSHGLEAASETPFLDFLKELFSNLLPLLINCIPMANRSSVSVTKALNAPNLRQRLGLRFHLRRNIDDPRSGNLRISEIEDALFKMGEGCTDTDTTAMMAEVS